MTDRRQFLLGLLGSTAALIAPPIIDQIVETAPLESFEAFFRRWYLDTIEIFANMQADVVVFGRGAVRTTDTYPFVELVPFAELPFNSTEFKGLKPHARDS